MTSDDILLARTAIDEAARLGGTTTDAVSALERGDPHEAIRFAVSEAHKAGVASGILQQRARHRPKSRRVAYRAEVQRLALLLVAPVDAVRELAQRFHVEPASVERAIARARRNIVRARPGIASAPTLRGSIRGG